MSTTRDHINGKFEYDDIKIDTFLTLPDNLDAAASLYSISGHTDDSLYMKTSTGWKKVGVGAYEFAEGLTDDGSGNISWGGTLSSDAMIDGPGGLGFGLTTEMAGFAINTSSFNLAASSNLIIASGSNSIFIDPTKLEIANDIHVKGQIYNPSGDTTAGNVFTVMDATSGRGEWHPIFQFTPSTTLKSALNIPPGPRPTSPVWGDVYSDFDNHLYFFNDSIWVQLDN